MGIEEAIPAAMATTAEAGAKGAEAAGSSLLGPAAEAGFAGAAGAPMSILPSAAEFAGTGVGAIMPEVGSAAAAGAGLEGMLGGAAGGGLGAIGSGAGFNSTGGIFGNAAAPGDVIGSGAGANATGGVFGSGGTGATSFAAPSAAAAGGIDLTAGGGAGAAGAGQAAGGGAAGAAGAVPGGTSFSFDSLLGSAGKSIMSNPIGVGLGAAGLGYNLFQNGKLSPINQQIADQANSLNAQGMQLAQYLSSGTLPAGLKTSLDQATSAAKAKVISNFASQGLSTDPTKNSALAQNLAAIDQQAVITTAQIGQQLMSTGIQESGMASSLYQTLSNIDATQTANIGKAIANMASALSPSKGLTLSLGK